MNEYTQEIWKKDSETNDLFYFIESYNACVGIDLQLIEQSERPDFICKNHQGEKVGIELSKVTRDPRDKQWDRIVRKKEFLDSEEAISMILDQVFRKNKKLYENDWNLPEETILILQLYDTPLSELHPLLFKDHFIDLFDTKFMEIWLGDYTQIEPFDCVDLFCLMPEEMFGTYTNFNQSKKPFG
ncbi:hypothetical protein H8E88_02855 [candidate division KSB1 bacterium]|nr:hypothetical protein [candidate division KSB1 bacterium]